MAGEENDQWFRDRNIDPLDIIANLKAGDPTRALASGGQEDGLYNNLDSPTSKKPRSC